MNRRRRGNVVVEYEQCRTPCSKSRSATTTKRRSDDPSVVRHADGTKLQHDAFETKVAIFDDRAEGWFFRVADSIASDGGAGYVLLQIAASQIEAIEQFRQGKSSKGQSSRVFVDGMLNTFREAKGEHRELLANFYSAVRCGLFHDGMTKTGVVISQGYDYAFAVVRETIQINPWRFLDAVRAGLREYTTRLRDPANVALREAFERRWAMNG